jgi:hypothetical protein
MNIRPPSGRLLAPLAVAVAVVALAGGVTRLQTAPKPPAAGQLSKQRVVVVPAATAHREPSYLPAGATRTFAGPHPRFTDTWIYAYALPGLANAESGQTPATSLTVTEMPGSTIQPPPADEYYGEQVVDVNGHSGSLSYPKSGYGGFRVDWTDGSTVYTILVNRLDTGASGISGVPADELLKVARSVGT